MRDKAKRLLIPFFGAIFPILIPRLYFAQDYQIMARPYPDNLNYVENNYFKYNIEILPHIHKKLSWLWFLPALFIDSNINYPLLVWSQRRKRGEPIDMKNDFMLILGQCLAFGIWCIPQLVAGEEVAYESLIPMVRNLALTYAVHFSA